MEQMEVKGWLHKSREICQESVHELRQLTGGGGLRPARPRRDGGREGKGNHRDAFAGPSPGEQEPGTRPIFL